jgi:hypothetical protein
LHPPYEPTTAHQLAVASNLLGKMDTKAMKETIMTSPTPLAADAAAQRVIRFFVRVLRVRCRFSSAPPSHHKVVVDLSSPANRFGSRSDELEKEANGHTCDGMLVRKKINKNHDQQAGTFLLFPQVASSPQPLVHSLFPATIILIDIIALPP